MKSSRALLPREGEMVLRAGSADDPAAARHRLEQPLEWQRLLFFADRERAALPLWRELRTTSLAERADGARVLKRMAQVWEFKLMHLERLLGQVLDAFAAAGVEVVLLKGAAAAASVYGGFSRRPMLDIDLLVEEGQAERAWTLAQSHGWRWDAQKYPRESYTTSHHLPPLHDAFGSSSGLEIHRHLWLPGHPFRFTEVDVWRGAEPVNLLGRSCLVPTIVHQLLHCCIHFAWSHRMQSHGWRAFSDVRAFVESGRVDWVEFIEAARASGAETCCYWTLRLAGRFTGISVPGEVMEALQPKGPPQLLESLERHYVVNLLPHDANSPSVGLAQRLWRLGIQRGPGSSGIDLPADPVRRTLGERLHHHSRRVPEWFRYFRQLM